MHGDRQTDFSIFDKQTTNLSNAYNLGFFNGAMLTGDNLFPLSCPMFGLHIEWSNILPTSSLYDQYNLNFTKLQT